MGDVIDRYGFRANVGIILMHDDGRLFIGRRSGGRGWQFPQGGMQRGERAEDSLYRELNEEIGLGATMCEIVGQTQRLVALPAAGALPAPQFQPLCVGPEAALVPAATEATGCRVSL